MDIGTLRGLGTLLAMLAFVGVAWWAWSGRQRARFDEASRLPLEEDPHKNEDK
jgi:cytochrome c oxidase cbb3-type subunit 4